MKIETTIFRNRYTEVSREFIRGALWKAGRILGGGKRVELSVSLIGNVKMRALNRQYRGKDKTTNVLSFRHSGEGVKKKEAADIGDILISIPEVKREARLYGWRQEYAIARLLVHGFLHLLGYDHGNEKEARRMEALERKLLIQVVEMKREKFL